MRLLKLHVADESDQSWSCQSALQANRSSFTVLTFIADQKPNSRELFACLGGTRKRSTFKRHFTLVTVRKHRDHWQSLWRVAVLRGGKRNLIRSRLIRRWITWKVHLPAMHPRAASRRDANTGVRRARERVFRPVTRWSYPRKSKKAGLSITRARMGKQHFPTDF